MHIFWTFPPSFWNLHGLTVEQCRRKNGETGNIMKLWTSARFSPSSLTIWWSDRVSDAYLSSDSNRSTIFLSKLYSQCEFIFAGYFVCEIFKRIDWKKKRNDSRCCDSLLIDNDSNVSDKGYHLTDVFRISEKNAMTTIHKKWESQFQTQQTRWQFDWIRLLKFGSVVASNEAKNTNSIYYYTNSKYFLF